MASFVHLHTHTDHSVLDGASTVREIVRKAAEDGQPALAITDHGTLSGVPEFFRQCNQAGIRPIAGSELYHTTGEMGTSSGETHHLTALAANEAGYRNLVQLSSRSHLDGFHRKPQVDWDLLDVHSEGLIVTSGCLGGMIPQAILAGDTGRAREIAGRYQDLYGPDNFFLELQFHGLPDQRLVNRALIDMSTTIGAPLVVTNDSHYTDAHHHYAHDALLCLQTGSKLAATDRLQFNGDQYWLKTAHEMRQLWHRLPEACDTTLAIAERCEFDLAVGRGRLPSFPVPEPHTSADDYLRALVNEGAANRWGDPLPAEAADRLTYELNVIANMGFSSYFLIAADIVRHAHESGIEVGPGRGSAAGCAVAYSLGITQLDPISHDLVFERFLNPQRVTMPDIDLDLGSERRDELLAYASRTYGHDSIAQITTFQILHARSAVRDSARVLGLPYAVGDRVARAIPEPVAGRATPMRDLLNRRPGAERAFRDGHDLRRLVLDDPDASQTVDLAAQLEGRIRAASTHPAAIVIAEGDISRDLPLVNRKGSPYPATQYGVEDLEELGYLKLDLLGVKVLDVIGATVNRVQSRLQLEPDLDSGPLTDPATYDMLGDGRSVGVFQFESAGIQALLRAMKPQGYEDVAAALALYRPGPMAADMHNDYVARKNGDDDAAAFHPDADEILAPTYGLCVYQEQLMRLAQQFAGFSPAEADSLRKAMTKKDRDLLDSYQRSFVDGCVANGYRAEVGERLFSTIRPFADYAFNKSHSYAYGLISIRTAYLKANWPTDFMASLLHAHRRDPIKTRQYLRESQRLGITLQHPHVNHAVTSPLVSADGDSITLALSAIKDVGDQAAAAIAHERAANGPYANLQDFCRRNRSFPGRAKATEALVRAGSFDSSSGPSRRHLLATLPATLTATRNGPKALAGTQTLFDETSGAEASTPTAREFTPRQLGQLELDSIGVVLSEPLADRLKAAARRHDAVQLAALTEDHPSQNKAVVAITDVKQKTTRRGDPMAIVSVEDLSAERTLVVFPNTFAALHQDALKIGSIVTVSASPDRGSDQLVAESIEPVDEFAPDLAATEASPAIAL